jgi:TRAP-type mannitol/chloroaromatic compound transport system permease large subunit
VVFILIGATRVQPDLPGRQRPALGRAPADRLPGGQLGFLIVVNVLIFLLAFFLDFFELSFIVVPLLAPVARSWAST